MPWRRTPEEPGEDRNYNKVEVFANASCICGFSATKSEFYNLSTNQTLTGIRLQDTISGLKEKLLKLHNKKHPQCPETPDIYIS